MIALMNIRGLIVAAWLLANTALIATVGGTVGWGEAMSLEVPTAPAQESPQVGTELLPSFQLPRLDKHFLATRERPLFVPTRRKAPPPKPPEPPAPVKPVMQKGQFRLLGSVVSDDLTAAILEEIATGRQRQVQKGNLINGLLLDQVEPDSAVLTQYDDREELRLKIQRSTKGAPGRPPVRQDPGRAQHEASPASADVPQRQGRWPQGQRNRPE